MLTKLIASLLPLYLLGCAHQVLSTQPNTDVVIATSSSTTNITQPIKIATWHPDSTTGRFTAMTLGRLALVGNCLTLGAPLGREGLDHLVLVLPDKSYVWDDKEGVLTYEGKNYRIGDEIYLGGGSFLYHPDHLLFSEIHWPQCGLDRGWLAN